MIGTRRRSALKSAPGLTPASRQTTRAEALPDDISQRDIIGSGAAITTGRTTARGPFRKADYEALAAFRARLRRFLRFSEDGARAAGLTAQQHQLLLAVKGTPGRDWCAVAELAAALQVKHHAAVGLVDRCERAGLVRRSRAAQDRRTVEVRLTPRGERILARLSARNRAELVALRAALALPFLDEPGRPGKRGRTA